MEMTLPKLATEKGKKATNSRFWWGEHGLSELAVKHNVVA
jgi:hypothetical protein